MQRFRFVAVTAAALVLPVTANALVIDSTNNTVSFGVADAGKTFTIDYFLGVGQDDNDGGAPAYDLSATFVYTITSFSPGSVGLTINVTNTTVDPDPTDTDDNADIVSFGFGVDPNVTAAFASGGEGTVFDEIGSGSGAPQNYPGGYAGIDVCIFEQGCSGGSVTNALHFGESDTVDILLSPVSPSTAFPGDLTLAFFPVKFQTNVGSFEFSGQPRRTTVPEPTTIALLGIGLCGLGMLRRLRWQPAARRRPRER